MTSGCYRCVSLRCCVCYKRVCLSACCCAELADSASIDTTITQVVDQFNRFIFSLYYFSLPSACVIPPACLSVYNVQDRYSYSSLILYLHARGNYFYSASAYFADKMI